MGNVLLVRFFVPEKGARLGCIVEDRVCDVSYYVSSVAELLRRTVGRAAEALEQLQTQAERAKEKYPLAQLQKAPSPEHPHLLSPVYAQDVWAAGVTYERSRQARQEEAQDGGDVYARVYEAERPELFFKSHGKNTVGPLDFVGIRADATWSVPEPELALVINPALEVVGFTIGNDMSSRDIEGANPLYLPQAKVYTSACAIGPHLVLKPASEFLQGAIQLKIEREGKNAFEGEIHTSRIKRPMSDLVNYLGRSNQFPDGVILLTGTGIVPPNEFTLAAGDVVSISIEGIGTLQNTVKVV